MPDTFAITIGFIILSTVIAAFIRGRSRDKCLKDFSKNMVTLEETVGKIARGKLTVENTGLELVYPAKLKNKDGHDKTSYILYKNEYPNIQTLIRFHDELDEHSREEREKELRRTYHPTTLRKLKRKIRNFFSTVKDSVMEVVNLLIGQAKRTAPGGATLASQDKYISQMKKELGGSMGTSFDPLLERHIGQKVILKLKKADKIVEYSGVLKDYTMRFVEIMDVDYKIKEEQSARKADLVVPREYGVIRHLGE
ncbi:MAG: hypothetical protein KAW52_00660 [candidate division Zixibacteria bacterium]|nr:hypothetical protein [candidate division Zixibacteria bacterium]